MASRKPVYLDFLNGELVEMETGDTIDTSVATNVGGGGGAFTDLSDVPASYTGQGTKVVMVNAGETGLEFATVSGTGDVVGPSSATANAIALFDGTTGKLIKDSTKVVTDFVASNAAVTGATKTKITYDSKGLVTGGADIGAADLPTGIDAAKIGAGSVDNTEFSYLNGVTSAIQTQINGKQATLGYTAENVANKATTYDTVNDTLYPTLQATENRYVPLSPNVSNTPVKLTSNTSQTIDSDHGLSIPEKYEIGSGFDLILSDSSILMIL